MKDPDINGVRLDDGSRSPTRRGEQAWIPGTEPPKNTAVDEAIMNWLDAKNAQRTAADTTKIRHAALLARMAEHKLERYGYVDPSTGKKRVVAVARDPRAKTLAAPRERFGKRKPEREPKPKPEVVEHRKVPRARVKAELAERDAAVRQADDPWVATGKLASFDEVRQAMAAIQPKPKRGRKAR